MSARTAIVAGGGIGGLAAAVTLRRAGYAVVVVERSARLDGAGAGLLLYPNGVAAIDAIGAGLGRAVRDAGYVTGADDVRVLMDAHGTVLAREPIGAQQERLGRPQIPILRAALRRALWQEAQSVGAEVAFGAAVTGYERRGERVSVRFADGASREADLLVAADGLRSVIRARMHDDGPPVYRGYTSVRGWSASPDPALGAVVASGSGLQVFVAPVGGGGHYWTAKITATAGSWPAMRPRAAQERLLALLEGWFPPVAALVRRTAVADLAVTDIHDRDPVDRWVDGPVVLIGDAAHPMVPALGQGANLALEDAVDLGRALVDEPDQVAGLRRFERVRVPRAAEVVLRSRRQGDVDQGGDRDRDHRRDQRIRVLARKDEATFDVVGWQPAPAGAPQQ
ncbi:FAD-dependent oxidoreductase [Actinoplanes sp. NPDC051494]|uniref:FAD-dependent oxidoreductase n=1 Tax=Actinoplanes sp. NPDC051494 TaxID=3363907 RepID=UPI00379C883E